MKLDCRLECISVYCYPWIWSALSVVSVVPSNCSLFSALIVLFWQLSVIHSSTEWQWLVTFYDGFVYPGIAKRRSDSLPRYCSTFVTHGFSYINIFRVPRKLFEQEAARQSVQISSEGPGKCYCNEITMDDRYSCITYDSNGKLWRKRPKTPYKLFQCDRKTKMAASRRSDVIIKFYNATFRATTSRRST